MHNHFDCLLQYLKKKEEILEELTQLQFSPVDIPERNKGKEKKASTNATLERASKHTQPNSCIACGEEKHAGRLFACKVFKKLNLSSKKVQLKRGGTCYRCLHPQGEDGSCTEKFLCSKHECQKRGIADHNYLLCPKPQIKKKDNKSEEQSNAKAEKRGLGLTERQEELLLLSPELKAEFKEAFSNKVSKTFSTSTGNKPKRYPVITMLLEVTTNSGQLVGTFINLAPDTNYMSNDTAEHLKLNGEIIKHKELEGWRRQLLPEGMP